MAIISVFTNNFLKFIYQISIEFRITNTLFTRDAKAPRIVFFLLHSNQKTFDFLQFQTNRRSRPSFAAFVWKMQTLNFLSFTKNVLSIYFFNSFHSTFSDILPLSAIFVPSKKPTSHKKNVKNNVFALKLTIFSR